MDKPILLEVIAPIPDRIGLCFSCQVVLQDAGMDHGHDAYPEEWRVDFERTLALVRRVSEALGPDLQIRWSDPRSMRGLYLSLRHRVRRYPSFILPNGVKLIGLQDGQSLLEERLEQARPAQ